MTHHYQAPETILMSLSGLLNHLDSVPLLEVKDVGCYKAPGQPIFSHVSFDVNTGDIIILQGKSGSGCVFIG